MDLSFWLEESRETLQEALNQKPDLFVIFCPYLWNFAILGMGATASEIFIEGYYFLLATVNCRLGSAGFFD